ncbi:MAG: PAS domain S-box protein [Phycisphaerales bacterium JB063]
MIPPKPTTQTTKSQATPPSPVALEVSHTGEIAEVDRGVADAFPYRLLFERVMDAVFISDMEDRILDVNVAACELYGYTREELLTMHVVNLQAPERRGKRGSVVKSALDRYAERSFETVDIRKDGSRIDVEVTTTQITTADGVLAMSIARDISERKRFEQALRDSERQLRQSQRIGRIGSWEFEVASGSIKWSEEMYRQFGRSPLLGPLSREELFSAYGEAGAQAVADAIAASIEQRDRVELDLAFTMPHGHKGVHNLVLLPVMDHDGVVLKIVGTTQDITDRKQAEEAVRRLNAKLEARVGERTSQLEQARRRLESVLESSPAVTYTASAAGEIPTTYVSPNFLSLFGYPASRAIANPFFLRSRIHRDDLPSIKAHIATLRATGRVAIEYRFLHGTGEYRWVRDELRLMRSPDGRPLEIAGMLTDISQRKRAEQRLELIQAAVEQVADGVVITGPGSEDNRFLIVYANPAFSEVSGHAMDNLLGCDPKLMYGPQTASRSIDALRRGLKRGKPFEIEITFHRADGEPFDAEVSFTPLIGHGGKPTHWVNVMRDVTQRKRDAELARLHQNELAHVTRLSTMGEMASGLAHELNQPLAAIANYGQGVLRRLESGRETPEGMEPAVRHIVTQAARAGEIIRRLRDFVTKRETHRSTVHINALVQDVIALVARDTAEQGAVIVTALDPDLPELVVDTIQIEQVVLNLIRNAAESMSERRAGERRPIHITTRQQEGQVIIAVSDLGSGLTAEQLDHLFDPFFTTKSQGMGMGLTISQSIIESHGGRLVAQNNVDTEGATLSIILPCISAD